MSPLFRTRYFLPVFRLGGITQPTAHRAAPSRGVENTPAPPPNRGNPPNITREAGRRRSDAGCRRTEPRRGWIPAKPAAAGNGKRHPLSAPSAEPPGQALPRAKPHPPQDPRKNAKNPAHAPTLYGPGPTVEPPGQALPRAKPHPPQDPRKNAKNPAHAPRFAGPAPTATTSVPDAFGQYPEGRVRRMIPVSVCAGCGPEVLAALSLIQHRCDIVNTLVGDLRGFFWPFAKVWDLGWGGVVGEMVRLVGVLGLRSCRGW